LSLDAQLLQSSFALIAEREPSVTHRFYEILFADYPQARPLFHESRRPAQERMLAEAIMAVLDHLDDAPWLTDTLGALGAKHVDYGVTGSGLDPADAGRLGRRVRRDRAVDAGRRQKRARVLKFARPI
jgi:hemoglobin-like flavoprotein